MATDKISKLRDKQKQLAEQIRREEGRLKAKERKEETRRKILVGLISWTRQAGTSSIKAGW